MEDANQQQESHLQQGAEKQRDPSEGHRIESMKQPYHGPEDRHGVSAHGIEGETDLRRAKQYAEMIVDTVREGLLVLNFDLQVEAANESFYRMFKVAPDKTEGRLIYELGNGQWNIPELRTLLEKVLPQHQVMTGFEVTHEFETLGRRIMRLNARQLDHHQRILLAIEDITEQEEAEEMLHVSEEKLREMNRSLEKRVAKRTAELRQQTTRLRSMAAELASAEQRERRRLAALLHDELQQLLYGAEMKLIMARDKTKEDETRAALEEAAERISEAVETARSLTRQLRPPALYEAGLTSALKWLAADMAERHGLEVTVDTDEVETDAVERSFSDDVKAMLYTCTSELLFNVVKYAGVDKARVALRIDESPNDADQSGAVDKVADRLRLVVEDEGRGFEVDRAFGKYTEEGGFGLLSIRERIAALGGSTEIHSRPGAGTRVELSVPLAAILKDEQVQPPARPEGLDKEWMDVRPHRAQVRVVIADDHAIVRQGIANLLVANQRTTVVGQASNGHEALELVNKERPDVVLMDVNMPEMNGVEATREIHSRWPQTAVIGISVQTDRAIEQSMLEAGAAAFAPKSGDVDQIIETILRVTGRSSQTEE